MDSFFILYNKMMVKVREISFAKFEIEFPDGTIRRLTDYSKFPGNEIQRWSFMRNTGDWDDDEMAEGIGQILEDIEEN